MRSRIIAAGIALTASLGACSSHNAITEDRQSPKPAYTLADVIPVKQPATPEEKQQQKKFLDKNVKRFKSRKAASAYYALEAKRNFNEAKLDSATLLFGRAWLMDSTNMDVYWGYGLVYGQLKEYDKALYILYRALEKDQHNPRLLTDLATSHLGRFYAESNPDDLIQSRKLLERAVRYSPNAADVYYKLAVSHYYLQEYGKAWEYLHKSISKDKNMADSAFIAALLEKQRDPAGKYERQEL
jgi:tetratricopeptide (TPR) repeat protein